MIAYFFDSSALVKRYVKETGTSWVITIFRPHSRHQIFVAEIVLVEVASALARRHRGLSVSSSTYGKRAMARFQKAFDTKFFKVSADLTIIQQAVLLAEKHFLRGYDAVQLATALQVERERKAFGASTIIFVSADDDLLAAAQVENLIIENPNHHP